MLPCGQMPSESQIAANRLNALNSTGPRTPEGKARSSANAIRHGLSAGFRVFTNESQQDFDELIAGLTRTFAPTNPYEEILVREIAQAHWRLARARRLEAATVDDMAAGHGSTNHDGTLRLLLDNKQANSFLVFQRYMAAAERSASRAVKQLLALRKIEADKAREAAVRNEPKSTPRPQRSQPLTHPDPSAAAGFPPPPAVENHRLPPSSPRHPRFPLSIGG